MHKRVRKNILRVLAVYALLCAIPYIFEDQFVFQEKVLSQDYNFTFDGNWEELFIPVDDSVQLNAILFKSSFPRKGIILYHHGNADNLVRWGKYRNDFLGRGYDVLMYDYRGYGKSNGSPSEENLLNDGLKVYDYLSPRYPGEQIIIYGRSLGTAVASFVAENRSAKSLFLETPFDQIHTALYSKFPFLWSPFPKKHNFSNVEPLQKGFTFPVHIFHGTKDLVVPLKSALRLKPFLKPMDSFTIIEGGDHKHLGKFPPFQKALDQYLGEKL